MNKKYLATAIIGTGALSSTFFGHQAEASTTHTVRSGESVWSISHRYGITIAKLKSLNGLSSNLIFPNQVLKVSGSASTNHYSNQSYQSDSGNTYTVRAGDSLSLIANRYGTTYRHIMDLNGLNSFLIFPGQKLKVSGSATTHTYTHNNNSSSISTGSTSTYTVRYGDSLSLIASRYNTTYQHIMQLNGLNNFFIYPGQQLKVSGTAPVHTQTTSTRSVTTTQSNYYSPTFNHSNLYDWGQCTWHVFNRRAAIGRGISTYWWNANNWDNAAARDGYRVDYSPAVGAIAQSDAGYYGHVAFVERVNSDGSILVSEMNYSASPGIATYRTIPAYQVRNYKFIH
ncbi:LysM peptidoglycan-binding domain-containing protein [Staphylococcus croceilyticus]|uniref:LysM peptidoglycan-binding domain-containing protein n=1 Tax=Staphylococcus croceilyticus TaxID=319942 RepID=A0ABY2KGI9_9STAP|nr:LysM peptidoglycan-binding domain-containing protein [Staphylococcus croceilyticus]PNZ67477.1 N-acetylmuramoyl-L-alanine amidase [Staphylococcus croceilyticus]TGA80766.1 LysM peptidoglycan-binding domain-containing protein [Staphylococcus croceilyticus]